MASPRKLELTAGAAALGVVVVSIVTIVAFWKVSIVRYFERETLASTISAAIVLALIAWEVWSAISIFWSRTNAGLVGRRSVVVISLVALVAGLAFNFRPTDSITALLAPHVAVWLGLPAVEPSTCPDFLIPILLLVQWFCLTVASGETERAWRGAAISGITYSAVLGTWTFSPFSQGSWSFFSDPTSTFFCVGVLIHGLAIFTLIRGLRTYGPAMAALVGFGCLAIGIPLINQEFASGGFGPIDSSESIKEIGSTLKFGWNGLTYHMPPIAYSVVAISSVALFLLQKRQPSQISQANSTPPDSAFRI